MHKVKLATKKYNHEARRKKKRAVVARKKTEIRAAQRRMRKMIREGRRQHFAKRQQEAKYIKELEGELDA